MDPVCNVKDLCPEKTMGSSHGITERDFTTETQKLREGGEMWASDLGNPL
jgi:hypothetical protein